MPIRARPARLDSACSRLPSHARNDLGGGACTLWELTRAWPGAEPRSSSKATGHTGSTTMTDEIGNRSRRYRLSTQITNPAEPRGAHVKSLAFRRPPAATMRIGTSVGHHQADEASPRGHIGDARRLSATRVDEQQVERRPGGQTLAQRRDLLRNGDVATVSTTRCSVRPPWPGGQPVLPGTPTAAGPPASPGQANRWQQPR